MVKYIQNQRDVIPATNLKTLAAPTARVFWFYVISWGEFACLALCTTENH